MAYDAKKIYYRFDDHLSRLVLDYEASRQISPESENLYHGMPTDPYDEGLFVEHNVKRGLRNADGSGVVAGLTRISYVHGYNKVDGKVVPDQGKLAGLGQRLLQLGEVELGLGGIGQHGHGEDVLDNGLRDVADVDVGLA